MKAEDLMVYAITDRYWLNGAKLADQVEDVLKNGATFLQLREKSFTHEEMVAEAKEIKAIAAKYQVPFVTWSIARRVKFWERIRLLVCRQEIYRKR